ncbi:MAG: aminoacyl-tRNA hydrolase [Bacteroidetes bacterium]|nr:aminoacyl-tRNA hydrolase [Bacteroidota bacterium]
MSDLIVNNAVRIPSAEIRFRFARSGGPGGQNVNKVESRAELLFDVRHSASFTETQRHRVLTALRTRLDADGVLHVVVQDSRSQWQNRERAVQRLGELLRAALTPRKRRVPTKRSAGSNEERITAKRRRGERKRDRRRFD